ncbi:PAS domain S-box protein [Martelella limonii]|uniref:PAS domain S-box protein n=1 Tax=Martelella limonii TaxID=1647649 RepID=UPI00158017F1|nr:PAS domain S-box protein [Martelella limonii]
MNITPEGVISYWSGAAEQLLGYSSDEIVGRNLFERLVPSRYETGFIKHLSLSQLSSDGANFEFPCLHKDGCFIDICASVAPIVTEGTRTPGYTAILENLAFRRSMQDRLVAILETIPTGVLVVDEAGTIDLVNRHFEVMSAYPRRELKGMKVEQLVPDKHRAAHAGHRHEYFRKPVPRLMGNGRDLTLRRKDGSEIPVEVGISAVAVPTGKQVLAIVTDISQRVETEERLNRQQVDLERTVEELTTFAYVASHDLKSPLRGIAQISQWIEEDMDDREAVSDHIRLLRSRIARMERLLNDLLAYSRAGRSAGGMGEVSIAVVGRDIFELLSPPEGMRLSLDGDLPTFQTLRTPLEQIIHNLFSNAIKHHDRAAEGNITLSCQQASRAFFEFCVKDDGPGIDPQYHERVFGMFQTLRPRDEVEGSGMGLALIRKIVTTFGGTVWIVSEAGQGCAVHFTWPVEIETKDKA